jgi:Ni/Co efflux regulator RcnB
MKKLLVALIAAAFAATSFAQAPKAADPAPQADKAEKKSATKKSTKAKGEKKAKAKSDKKAGGMEKKAAAPAAEKKDGK